MRWAGAAVLCALGCGADETLVVVTPSDAAYVATEDTDGSGAVDYSAMRAASSGLLFETHPDDAEGLRVLVWRADAFGDVTVDESDPLEPASSDDDVLPPPEFLRVDADGSTQPVASNNTMTPAWWRRRPDPCRNLLRDEYRHGLPFLSVSDVSAYEPKRSLAVGIPRNPAGSLSSVVVEVGAAIPLERGLTSTVSAVDVAWGEGRPWYLLLSDGRVWSVASQLDTVTAEQFLGSGRLEEGIDASVIHVVSDGGATPVDPGQHVVDDAARSRHRCGVRRAGSTGRHYRRHCHALGE